MPFRMVVVGSSLGGLQALETFVSCLPEGFPVPIAIVQHRSPEAGDLLRRLLQRHTALRVREPNDKDAIAAGHIYLAPPDYHLMVGADGFSLSTDAPVSYARPAIDVLFESAAEAYGPETIGIVLTGANEDGACGAARIKARGGFLIVQDPASAECPIMPAKALAAAAADRVLPLVEICPFLVELCAPAAR